LSTIVENLSSKNTVSSNIQSLTWHTLSAVLWGRWLEPVVWLRLTPGTVWS